jgi:hypothetical protein
MASLSLEERSMQQEIFVRSGRLRRVFSAEVPGTSSIVVDGQDDGYASAPLSVVLESSRWRHDIESWRYLKDASPADDWRGVGIDDKGWATCPHPWLRVIDAVDEDSTWWFRTSVQVPRLAGGEDLSVILGVLDDESWREVHLFINGVQLQPETAMSLPSVPRYRLPVGTDAHRAVSLGGWNVLAVRCRGIDRRAAARRPCWPELGIYRQWLSEQAIVAGPASTVVSDFDWDVVCHDPDGEIVLVGVSGSTGLEATVTHRPASAEAALQTAVSVRNTSAEALTVLDILTETLTAANGTVTGGGRGFPALIDDTLFVGIERLP